MVRHSFPWIVFAHLVLTASSSTDPHPELDANFKSYKLTDISVYGPVGGNVGVTFSAFGKKYKLTLQQAYKMPVNVTISGRYETRTVELKPEYYIGRVLDRPVSFAHGVMEGGFAGSVYWNGRSNDDIIYVEPLCRFVKNVVCSNKKSVVYKRSEVRMEDKPQHMQYRRAPSGGTRFKTSNDQQKKTRRKKRGVISGTICQVFFTLDHTFYQLYAQSNAQLAYSEVAYFLMEATKAFEDTDFDGDGAADKVGFDLQGLHIFETVNSPQYKMAGNLDSDAYLDTFSEYDFENYCLAAAFAHRDFSGGVLGLAWIASTTAANKAGGICQSRLLTNPPMSYNTLIVTTLNYGQTQPKSTTSLTLTHEFGHSFGSNHDNDNDAVCSPSNLQGGKYLMHPFSSDTNRPNNWKFSPCSRAEINPILSDKSGCFADKKEPFCGDMMIDPGEECDCGPEETCEEVDPCCEAQQCLLKAGNTCTPLDITKPCCTQNCQAASASQLCRLGGECKKNTYCDGSAAACPAPVSKADGTFCYFRTAVCEGGSCSESVCSLLSLEECQCTGERDLCFVCCVNANGECVHVEKADPSQNAVNESIPHVPGQSCNEYKGFCDDRGECVKTGRKGARDRLNKFLRDGMIKRWLANYGLYIGLSIATFIILAIVLKTIYKKKKAAKAPAYNMAKVALLWQEANKHYEELFNKLEQMRKEYREFMIDELDYNKMSETDISISLAKLCVLFPSVPEEFIRRKVKKWNTEQQVVENFIREGVDMKKIL